nr:MAG TPA: hypothetical protein [Caudoviricetes sp.]
MLLYINISALPKSIIQSNSGINGISLSGACRNYLGH